MGIIKKISVEKKLDYEKLPNHIAFIMDGNGRYATSRGMPRNYGHKKGLEALKDIIQACYELGIKIITFYLFSTENWKRPKEEIDYIFSLAREFSKENVDKYKDEDIKVVTMGDITKLPNDLQDSLIEIVEKTKDNSKMLLNLAINYGGRSELVRAFNNMILDGVKEVSEEKIKEYLYSANIADPDLIIRTSGELRVSNFMLYQLAYSEMAFPKNNWPEMNKKELVKILIDYQNRTRRFGGLNK